MNSNSPNFNNNWETNQTNISTSVKLFLYCLISTICCFLLAWGLMSGFDEDFLQFSIFLSIAPGIIIGAIIYHISKPKVNAKSMPEPSRTIHFTSPKTSEKDKVGKLVELKKLLDSGVISESEFEKLKQEFLNK